MVNDRSEKAATPVANEGINVTQLKEFDPPSAKGSSTAVLDKDSGTKIAGDSKDGGSYDVAQATSTVGQGKTVYVDIGHCTSVNPLNGKRDVGFEVDGYNECEINKSVGKMLMSNLKDAGFRVVPTWNPDSPPGEAAKADDLQRRNARVNDDIDKKCEDSIYVSVHHDNDPTKAGGQCVYIAEPKSGSAMPLAKSIQSSAWKVRPRDGAPGCINMDTKTQNGKLVGLRGVNTHGALIEGANSANPDDKVMMSNPIFQVVEAGKIAEGIKNYFKLKPGTERPYPACFKVKS